VRLFVHLLAAMLQEFSGVRGGGIVSGQLQRIDSEVSVSSGARPALLTSW
jgi:hypothetical protein